MSAGAGATPIAARTSSLTLLHVARPGDVPRHAALGPPRGPLGPLGDGAAAAARVRRQRRVAVVRGRVARDRLLVEGVEFEAVAVLWPSRRRARERTQGESAAGETARSRKRERFAGSSARRTEGGSRGRHDFMKFVFARKVAAVVAMTAKPSRAVSWRCVLQCCCERIENVRETFLPTLRF